MAYKLDVTVFSADTAFKPRYALISAALELGLRVSREDGTPVSSLAIAKHALDTGPVFIRFENADDAFLLAERAMADVPPRETRCWHIRGDILLIMAAQV